MESTREPKVLDLSSEILSLIFTHFAGAPTSFSRVCKTWRDVAQQEYNLAQYILNRYGRREALYYAILHLGSPSSTLFQHLIRLGAHTSLYLWRHLWRHIKPQQFVIESHVPPSWGSKVSHQAIYDLGSLTEKQLEFGQEIAREISKERGSLSFMLWEELLLQINEIGINAPLQHPVPDMDAAKELLEDLWLAFEAEVVLHGWVPFSPLDFVVAERRLERAVCLEPRLLPLLNKNGWDYDAERNDGFVRSLLLSKQPSPIPQGNPGQDIHQTVINGTLTFSDRYTILAKDIKLYARRFPRFHISARVCGEVMSEVMRSGENRGILSEAVHVITELETAGLLGFAAYDTLLDNTYLVHGTRISVVNARNIYTAIAQLDQLVVPQARFAHLLGKAKAGGKYQDWTHEDSPISGSLRSSSWIGASVKDPAPSWAEDEDKALDQIVDLICNPFLLSAEFILREEALLAKPHRDLPNAARRAAVRMVRMPSKGATLLSLVTQHPFLASHIRTEILRHRISLDLLSSPSAGDTSRPLYNSHHPTFLSPLGFDYENALERFILPLGANPWVEGCYAADPPPSSAESPFAESVWPIQPRRYFVGEGDQKKNVGFVTGKTMAEAQLDPSEEMAEWTKEREIKGSLPLAIALLDIFDKDDEALDVVLGHAILNLNPSVVSCYLKEGVPLRSHHLEALDKLQLPRLVAINLHLVEQEARASTAMVVEEQTPDKPKRKRGGARARRAREKAMAPVVAGAA